MTGGDIMLEEKEEIKMEDKELEKESQTYQ
jgi:hypothetical protein